MLQSGFQRRRAGHKLQQAKAGGHGDDPKGADVHVATTAVLAPAAEPVHEVKQALHSLVDAHILATLQYRDEVSK